MPVSSVPRRAYLVALLSLMALPMVAHATITPDAKTVIDTISAFGFTGTIEAWTQRPDRVASATVLGPFTLKDGFDGTTSWRIDQNGKLTQRDGKDLENEKGQAWFENDRWLESDQGGGSITVKNTVNDSTGKFTVLEITPPTGRPHDMWFDNGSGLRDEDLNRVFDAT